MLKRIEIRNFESHKETVIDCLSDGLNLFRGESNAGKTSIVRALKLVAYNEYDPKSLRTGETKCEVIVETDKGIVKVVRGPKINFWEVTPKGQPPIAFDKVGKAIIPEAARVIGLNIVRLGDADIPVNIMDQLESHFMLASLGGQDASGSLRAQVIDEISGLSGIEGVIKAVSLDNHRFGKEIKETELKMQETQGQLHDENALNDESSLLTMAGTALAEYDECVKAQADAEVLLAEITKADEAVQESESKLKAMPDFKTAQTHLDKAQEAMDKADKAEEVFKTVAGLEQGIQGVEIKLKAMPDAKKALCLVEETADALDKADRMSGFLSEYQKITDSIEELESDLEILKQMGDPTSLLDLAQIALETATKAQETLERVQEAQDKVDELYGRLKANEAVLKKAEVERDGILAQVKVCPLTLRPVSPECLK